MVKVGVVSIFDKVDQQRFEYIKDIIQTLDPSAEVELESDFANACSYETIVADEGVDREFLKSINFDDKETMRRIYWFSWHYGNVFSLGEPFNYANFAGALSTYLGTPMFAVPTIIPLNIEAIESEAAGNTTEHE